jgi:hypothetical protein
MGVVAGNFWRAPMPPQVASIRGTYDERASFSASTPGTRVASARLPSRVARIAAAIRSALSSMRARSCA